MQKERKKRQRWANRKRLVKMIIYAKTNRKKRQRRREGKKGGSRTLTNARKRSKLGEMSPVLQTSVLLTIENQKDHLRMNVVPDQTIILGLKIFLNYRSLSSID